jgi:hypothetical protein
MGEYKRNIARSLLLRRFRKKHVQQQEKYECSEENIEESVFHNKRELEYFFEKELNLLGKFLKHEFILSGEHHSFLCDKDNILGKRSNSRNASVRLANIVETTAIRISVNAGFGNLPRKNKSKPWMCKPIVQNVCHENI